MCLPQVGKHPEMPDSVTWSRRREDKSLRCLDETETFELYLVSFGV